MNIRGLVIATAVAVVGIGIPFVEATEDFKTFFGGLTSAATPLGSGDKIIVLQGGADKEIAGNILVTLTDSQTLTNKTINGASNTLTLNAATQLSGIVGVASGGLGIGSGNSGGVPCYTGSTTIASSAAFTANLPLIGSGAGACPGVGSVTGTAGNPFVVSSGAHTSGHGASWDASGNLNDNANAVFTNVPNSFTAQQTFASTLGTQNNQSGTSYTLVSSDCGKTVYFTSSSPVTVTLPNNLPVPCTVQLEEGGAGQLQAIPASGATGPSNPHGFTKTFGQFAVITVFVDTNSGTNGHWILTGDGA